MQFMFHILWHIYENNPSTSLAGNKGNLHEYLHNIIGLMQRLIIEAVLSYIIVTYLAV